MTNQIITSRITKNRRTPTIYFADIETCIISNTHYPVIIGAAGKLKSKTASFFFDSINPQNMIKDYLNESNLIIVNFFNRFTKDSIIYFHNLGRFDAYILIKYLLNNFTIKNILERDRVIYSITFINKHNKAIQLRDSYLITNTPINSFIKHKLAKKQKVENNQEIYSNMLHFMTNNKEQVINLLKTDIFILREGMQNIHTIIKNNFNYDIYQNALTIAGISFNVFLNNYNDTTKNPIYKLTLSQDEWIRASYHGGITEVYKPYAPKGFVYDINSAYPYAMTDFLPIGKPTRLHSVENLDLNTFFGFVSAIVHVPKDTKLPPLMISHPQRGLISPTGTFQGTWFSEELAFAQTFPGVSIDPIEAISYEKGCPFKEYIQNLYQMRLHAKETGQTALAQITKLLLNSLYGRFGMQIKRTKTAFLTIEQIKNIIHSVKDYSEQPITNTHYYRVTIDTLQSIDQIQQKYPDKTSDQIKAIYELQGMEIKTCVAIASAITAKARVHLRKIIRDNNIHPIYCDTDSIVTTEPILNSDIVGNKLGQIKLETSFINGYFVDIKSYLYTDTSTNIKKLTLKGVPLKQRDHTTIEQLFKAHINDPNQNLYTFIDNTKNFVRDYNDMTIIIKNFNDKPTKHLDYNKRNKVIIYNENNQPTWTDTTPINIQNEELTQYTYKPLS